MKTTGIVFLGISILFFGFPGTCFCKSMAFGNKIFDPGPLKPVDSVLKIKIGDTAPDFTLTSITGSEVRLSSYIGRKNVMLSFIPAAWTPVCSDQWPGYNIAEEIFRRYDTILIGISTDPLPTLFAWTRDIGGLWFDVVSDFWPHGAVSETYGVLRSNGTAERAIILIDKKGVIRFIHVGDINLRPDLGMLVREMEKLNP
ncbi:MAG: redoxin domain-containing protein [Desulfobacula sp.]|nr:redoxin domain-containing protein [Desulfobacula sp.]